MTLREEQKLYKEAQNIARHFIKKPGITDIEFGLKHKGGKLTEEISLRFKVQEKKVESELKPSELLPKNIGNFKTDVLTNLTNKQQHRNENPRMTTRPIIGGIQIQSGIYRNTVNYWGTVGCYLTLKNQIMGLTNYHVLYGGATPDLVSTDYVGRLAVHQNLNRQDNQIGVAADLFSYELDYATFILQVPFDNLQSINFISGRLKSYAFPQINMQVIKSGACTDLTYGIIDGRSCINCSELSIYIDTQYPSSNEIISDFGDSGSIWILNDNSEFLTPIALHYGGGETLQWAKAKSFSSIFASIRNKTKNQII
jgi:hypothetical protein